jgi:hypothetical protein
MKPFKGNHLFINDAKPFATNTPNAHSNNITIDGEYGAFSDQQRPNVTVSVTG